MERVRRGQRSHYSEVIQQEWGRYLGRRVSRLATIQHPRRYLSMTVVMVGEMENVASQSQRVSFSGGSSAVGSRIYVCPLSELIILLSRRLLNALRVDSGVVPVKAAIS